LIVAFRPYLGVFNRNYTAFRILRGFEQLSNSIVCGVIAENNGANWCKYFGACET